MFLFFYCMLLSVLDAEFTLLGDSLDSTVFQFFKDPLHTVPSLQVLMNSDFIK